MEQSIATLRRLGAQVIDPLMYPDYLLQSRQALSSLIMQAEFKAQIGDYLRTTQGQYPKSFEDVVRLSNDPSTHYRSPQKAFALQYSAAVALDVSDPIYVAAAKHGLGMTRATMSALFEKHRLDAIVYPTSPRPAALIEPPSLPPPASSATNIANQTGFPAGMTKDGLPVTISFFGLAYSEPKLLGYGYDFERATQARALPKYTPPLASDFIKW